MMARRPGLRIVAAMAAALLLSACWSGPALFTAWEATPNVLADGIYLMNEPGRRPELMDPAEGIRVTNQADGSMRVIAGDDDKYDLRVLAVSLSKPADRRFVLQATGFGSPDDPAAMYALLDLRQGAPRLSILPCTGEVQKFVTESGGIVSRDPQSASGCEFANRDVLLAQLKHFAAMEAPSDDVVELTKYRP